MDCERVVYDPMRGEAICADDGTVIGEILVDQPEWRAHSRDEILARSRRGPVDTALIARGARRVSLEVPRGAPRHVSKSTKPEAVGRGSAPRWLVHDLVEIKRVCEELDLPFHVAEEAGRIYQQAFGARNVPPPHRVTFILGAVYLAIRLNELPYQIDDLLEVVDHAVTKWDVSRAYRRLVEMLDVRPPLLRPEPFVLRFSGALGLPAELVGRALEYVRLAREHGIPVGKDPVGVAAAAIYLAVLTSSGSGGRTQREIAEVAGITEATLRRRYKELSRVLLAKLGLDALIQETPG